MLTEVAKDRRENVQVNMKACILTQFSSSLPNDPVLHTVRLYDVYPAEEVLLSLIAEALVGQ